MRSGSFSAITLATLILHSAEGLNEVSNGYVSYLTEDGYDFSRLKCTIDAFTDVKKCFETKTDDGEPCDYCSVGGSDNYDEKGLCVSPEIAESMKAANSDIKCKSDPDDDVPVASNGNLKVNVDQKLKCTVQGSSSEHDCGLVSDQCLYCSKDNVGHGACLDSSLIPDLRQMIRKMSCSTPVLDMFQHPGYDNRIDPKADVTCTKKSLNIKKECLNTRATSYSWCEFCFDGSVGICVNPDQSDHIMESGQRMCVKRRDDLVATGRNLAEGSKSGNPVSDCYHMGLDEETCTNSAKTAGEECFWCRDNVKVKDDGVCIAKTHRDLAGSYLNCNEEKEEASSKTDSDTDDANDGNCKFITEKRQCVKDCHWLEPKGFADAGMCLGASTVVGFELHLTRSRSEMSSQQFSECTQSSVIANFEASCTNEIDSEYNKNCVFCKPKIAGGKGVCMPPNFSGKKGKFYECTRS